jgi:hypothetical protein
MTLERCKTYLIDYQDKESYKNYSGTGVYSSSAIILDNEQLFLFTDLENQRGYTSIGWFPLTSIITN